MDDDKHPAGVKAFWEEQARAFGVDPAATLADPYWRELEMRVMLDYVRKLRPKSVLDVGCGNGFSTAFFARQLPRVKFVGVDYSERMIAAARAQESPNCVFRVADVLRLESLPEGKFDVVLTQRCLQNILSYELQATAIRHLIQKKAADGALLLMECSEDGLPGFNAVSRLADKARAPKKPPFHNLWFRDERLRKDFNADVKCFCSSYMFAKALHPKLRPLGLKLPQVGRFGYERLYILK